MDQALVERGADKRLALVDIGSNSVRLVVFDRGRRQPLVLFNEKVLCGLGAHMETTGRLDPEGIELALPNLRRFTRLAREMGVDSVVLLATAAVRDAEDRSDFIREVESLTGEPLILLSGKEEAMYSGAGVISGVPHAQGFMGDLGGGSLELMEIGDGKTGRGVTLPLGTLRLAELSGGDLAVARKHIRAALEKIDWLGEQTAKDFYPVGGTWRNMARIFMALENYPLQVIQQYEIKAGRACALCEALIQRHPRSLKYLRHISSRRIANLPYGAILMDEILKVSKAHGIVFSAHGLREGYLYSQQSGDSRERDPLLASAREIGARRARFGQVGEALFAWTEGLFDREPEEWQRLRLVACWLSDVGWREHTDYRAQHVFSWVIQHPFDAIDHSSRVFLAYTLFCRYNGDPIELEHREVLTLLTQAERRRAEVLGEALKLAFRISGATPGILARTRLDKADKADGFELILPQDGSLYSGKAVKKTLKRLNKLYREATAAGYLAA